MNNLNNLKQGDIIQNEHGKRKILGVCGEVCFLSLIDEFGGANSENWTIKELEDEGYTLAEQSRWKPEDGDKYWYIDSYGDVEYKLWSGGSQDYYRYSIGIVFKSFDDPRIEEYKKKLLELGE